MEIILIILAVVTAPIWMILLFVGMVLLYAALQLVFVFLYVIVVLTWTFMIFIVGTILAPFVMLADGIKTWRKK